MAKPKAFSGNIPALRKCGATTCTPQDQTTTCPPQDHTQNCDSQYQIDKLPDDVLVTILNFLALKEAAITSVISRRWEHLWKHYTLLDFDASKAVDMIAQDHSLLETERAKYVDWVNQIDSGEEHFEFPELPSVKQLTLNISVDVDFSLLIFASMVNAFPCLQKLAIKLSWLSPKRLPVEMESIPSRSHKCLKVVEFGGYYGRTCDLALAMYFIKNAVALEELIIDPRENQWTPESREAEEATARSIAKQQFENLRVAPQTKLKIL